MMKITHEDKMIEIPIERKAKQSEFIDYCLDFYGPNGIYDMGAKRDDIAVATGIRMAICDVLRLEFCGDTLDREAVRDVLIDRFGCKWPTDK
jgi:hypothetical protein